MSLASLLGIPPECAFDTDRDCNGYCRALMQGHFGAGYAEEAIASIIYTMGAGYLAKAYSHCSVPYNDKEPDDAEPRP